MVTKRRGLMTVPTVRTVAFLSFIQLALLCQVARGQSASVRGLVTDPTGAVVADAHVSLTNERTGTVEQQ